MTQQGYLDWQRVDQEIGGLFVNVAADAAAPSTFYGPFSVAVWSALNLRVTPGAAGFRFAITFRWFADEAMTQAMGDATYDIQSGAIAIDQVVNLGPWVQVEVFSFLAAPNNTYAFRLAPMSAVSPRARQVPTGFALSATAFGIAAGVTSTVASTAVFAGSAYVAARSLENTAATFVLTTVGAPVAGQNIWRAVLAAGAATSFASDIIYVPGVTLQIAITNNDAAARTFDFVLIPLM